MNIQRDNCDKEMSSVFKTFVNSFRRFEVAKFTCNKLRISQLCVDALITGLKLFIFRNTDLNTSELALGIFKRFCHVMYELTMLLSICVF